MQDALILADSLNIETGDRLTTFVLPRFPKCLLAELNTHRVFSRNAASSRAIPIHKMIERIKEDPYIPQFTQNQKGMVGSDRLTDEDRAEACQLWMDAMHNAIHMASRLSTVGVHKQEANRLLEPFMRVPVLVTATQWDNFLKLRTAPDAQPDFRKVAIAMQQMHQNSKPDELKPGAWHIPFVNVSTELLEIEYQLKVSAARCARISYTGHDGNISPEKDYALHDRLIEESHMSPLEHAARALKVPAKCRNFQGWMQYRAFVEESIPVV